MGEHIFPMLANIQGAELAGVYNSWMPEDVEGAFCF